MSKVSADDVWELVQGWAPGEYDRIRPEHARIGDLAWLCPSLPPIDIHSLWHVLAFDEIENEPDAFVCRRREREERVQDEHDQPMPIKNDHPAVWDLVMADIEARDKIGQQRYGTRLQPHNGRDALRDAYEEALDLVVYLRQAIYGRDNPEG